MGNTNEKDENKNDNSNDGFSMFACCSGRANDYFQDNNSVEREGKIKKHLEELREKRKKREESTENDSNKNEKETVINEMENEIMLEKEEKSSKSKFIISLIKYLNYI